MNQQSVANSNAHDEVKYKGVKRDGRVIAVKILQLVVGAIVTFGGAAFTAFALNDLGRTLGELHLAVGLLALVSGFAILIMKQLPTRFLLAINALTIAYSSFAEVVVETQPLLPADAAFDSLLGTIVAVAVSVGVIYLITRPGLVHSPKK